MDINELFTIFGYTFHAYGLLIAIGLIACFATLRLLSPKVGIRKDSLETFELFAIIAIALGFGSAALFQAFYNFVATGKFVWQGITFLGGLIGGVATFLILMLIFRKKELNEDFPKLLEIAPMAILIAHAFGRVGCFIAGCCYGAPSEHGFKYDFLSEKVIPTNLYEAIFLFIFFAVLVVMLLKFNYKFNMPTYLIGYGVFRFVIEFFRGDDRGELIKDFSLSPSQILSIFLVLAGIALIFYYIYRGKKKAAAPPPTEASNESEKI